MAFRWVTPAEAEALQPSPARTSSADLGWNGIELHIHSDAPPGELITPPCTHHTLILNRRALGRLTQARDGVTVDRRLAPGDLLLCPAGMPSRWQWHSRADVVGLYIAPGLIGGSAEDFIHGDPRQIEIENSFGFRHGGIEQIVGLLADEVLHRSAGTRLYAESLAGALAVLLLRTSVRSPRRNEVAGTGRGPEGLSRPHLHTVLEFIEAHLAEDLSLMTLSARVQLSPAHFVRRFRQSTGSSPHDYIVSRRVELARALMAKGELSLSGIAAAAGFCDQSHLTRHFKRRTGMTPASFIRAKTSKA